MEDDRLMIERILILVRNVLHIPANPAAEKRTDDDASVHDQVGGHGRSHGHSHSRITVTP